MVAAVGFDHQCPVFVDHGLGDFAQSRVFSHVPQLSASSVVDHNALYHHKFVQDDVDSAEEGCSQNKKRWQLIQWPNAVLVDPLIQTIFEWRSASFQLTTTTTGCEDEEGIDKKE